MLRPYQEKAVDMIRRSVASGKKRILLVLPTGSGKSHILTAIASGCISKGNNVLSLVHRRQLVTQLTDHYTNAGLDTGIIMSGINSETEKPCQVASMLTYNRRLQLLDLENNRFFIDCPVVLIDEAHHVLSESYQRILKNYKNKIVIGVTATPCLSNGYGMGNYFDDLICPVTVKEMIDQGYLVPGWYFGPSAPDLNAIKTVAGDYEKKGLDGVMNTPKLVGEAVDNWVKYANGLRTMAFCVTVSHSKNVCKQYNDRGIKAEHLDAHHGDEEREAVLERFRNNETMVVCNVGLYTEGTDVKEIQCIQILCPTKSDGKYIQVLGRGARPNEDKEHFVVLDHGGCVDRLGLYEDYRLWSLDGKKPAISKKQKREKKQKLLTCDECTFKFTGSKCPQCGTAVKDYGKKMEALEAELVEINTKKRTGTPAEKLKWYRMLLYHARMKGIKDGWAYYKVKEKFGSFVRGANDVTPIEPDAEVARHIKYLNIKYIKGKQRQEQANAI